MKKVKLKMHMVVGKYMLNTKRERHTREDNSNNINIKGPTCIDLYCIFILLYCASLYYICLFTYFPVR